MLRPVNKLLLACALTIAILVFWRIGGVTAASTSPVVTILQPVAQSLRSPVRAIFDADNNLYVTDTRNGGIVKLNQFGIPIQTIRTAGVPQGIAIAQDGKLLVSQGTFVAILNNDGSEVTRLSAQFKSADGIAVDDVTGFIYVTDSSAHQILVFTASGSFVKTIGSRGTANGQFFMPTGIAFEKTARQIAVADTLNCRIQFFDVNGVFIKKIGISGTGPMKFTSPQGIAFEYSKDSLPLLRRMYVVDSFQGNVQVIDPAGAGTALYLAGTNPLNNYIGSYGSANGQLSVPTDVIFDGQNNRLLVTNGFGNVTAFGIDGGSNPADTTPPTLAIDPVLANVSAPDLTISGAVEANANVFVTTSTTAIAGPVVFTSSTTWKCDIKGLTGGDNVITVTARDAAGNSTQQTVSVRYTLPAPMLTLSPSNATLTNSSTVIISGTVDADASVAVTNTATSVSGSATVTGTAWTYAVALSEGANHFAITAQKPMSDKAFASADITLDSAAPQLAVSALADGSFTSTQVQNITGTVRDAGSVKVLINGQETSISNNSFSSAVTLSTGANLISVVAVDAAGNASIDSRTINFDSTQPVITVASPMDNSITNASVVTIGGTVDKTSVVSVSGVAAVMNGNEWTADINLLAGLNTIEITATDLYGNSSTVKRSIVQDSTKPVLAISSPSQDIATNNPSITIAGTVSDNSELTLVYSVNGVTAAVPITAGTFTFDLTLTKEGQYPVVLTLTDVAGNTTSATRNIIYDITPPNLSLDTYKGANPTSLTGTVEAGAGVAVKDGTVNIGRITVNANGTWSADLTGVSYDLKLVSVVATDAAGNTTVKSLAQVGTDASGQAINTKARTNILWRNTGTTADMGKDLLWLMDGVTRTASVSLTTLTDLTWTIAGRGDFNGDGYLDILWRNTSTGVMTVWYMKDAVRIGTANISPVLSDLNWKVVGLGDFNGDGKVDILFRNIGNTADKGKNLVWYMNGVTRTGTASITALTDLNWTVVGVNDFNKDGKADILWRNISNTVDKGKNVIWYMDGTNRTGTVALPGRADLNWAILGTGDFNNDMETDILWRNTSTGLNEVWFLSNGTQIGTASIPALSDQNWKMMGN